MKVRPDFLPDRMGSVPEYKSTADASEEAFKRDAYNFGYHLQAALYLRGVKEVLGETPDDFVFVCQEKEPPYLIEVYGLEDEWLEWAEIQLRYAIRLFAHCLETDHWPGSSGELKRVPMRGFDYATLQRLHEAGAFEVAA